MAFLCRYGHCAHMRVMGKDNARRRFEWDQVAMAVVDFRGWDVVRITLGQTIN